jgi:hypothetical protein
MAESAGGGGGGVGPEGESLRRALRWLGERRRADPSVPRARLVNEAAQRFDLSPKDEEFLLLNWRES